MKPIEVGCKALVLSGLPETIGKVVDVVARIEPDERTLIILPEKYGGMQVRESRTLLWLVSSPRLYNDQYLQNNFFIEKRSSGIRGNNVYHTNELMRIDGFTEEDDELELNELDAL